MNKLKNQSFPPLTQKNLISYFFSLFRFLFFVRSHSTRHMHCHFYYVFLVVVVCKFKNELWEIGRRGKQFSCKVCIFLLSNRVCACVLHFFFAVEFTKWDFERVHGQGMKWSGIYAWVEYVKDLLTFEMNTHIFCKEKNRILVLIVMLCQKFTASLA